ncbi:hypothetical protein [Aquimarina sp. 2201CG14-23]|uniref:hypothetical protein n=1 Tax=Aquimarina mycalae TaxID=3040073 RepID=UPI0024782558|nr:hypothetical protein [Aquimarina sp. 2201CG14-23]MDH7445786.1 hypothetical protein [Aquimarina sp. 2201CG14-23]
MFANFSSTEYRQTRIAYRNAIVLIRQAHYALHDYITIGRQSTVSTGDRIRIENALFNSFYYFERNNSSYTRRNGTNSNNRFLRDYGYSIDSISRNLNQLNRHATHYEVQRSWSDMDGDDFIRVYESSNDLNNVVNRIIAYSVRSRPHVHTDQRSREHGNIYLNSGFFTLSADHQIGVIIHEMCHTVLRFGFSRTTPNSNDTYMQDNGYDTMTLSQAIVNPDKYAQFILLLAERSLL